MGTWVLVLVLAVGNQTSLTSVPGYTTKKECKLAGDEWVKWWDEIDEVAARICVPGPREE